MRPAPTPASATAPPWRTINKTVLISHLLHPARFAHRIGRIPVGLDMHRGDDIVRPAVGQKIIDQIIVAHRAVVTIGTPAAGIVQPWIGIGEIPQMMMRIDFADVLQRMHDV
jgi:hypothetical protein